MDIKRLKDRETTRIAQLKDQAADRGKGVSKEAQAIYDALKRVYVKFYKEPAISRQLLDIRDIVC